MKEDKETQAAVKAAMASHAKLVVGDEQHRQEYAMLQGILAKYNVALVPRAMISPGGIEFMIETQCVPKDVLEKQEADRKAKEAARKVKKKPRKKTK
jgi:hypothetical protein